MFVHEFLERQSSEVTGEGSLRTFDKAERRFMDRIHNGVDMKVEKFQHCDFEGHLWTGDSRNSIKEVLQKIKQKILKVGENFTEVIKKPQSDVKTSLSKRRQNNSSYVTLENNYAQERNWTENKEN